MHAEAEPLFRRSLAIREKALGPQHPDVAQSLNNQAGLLEAQVIAPYTWKALLHWLISVFKFLSCSVKSSILVTVLLQYSAEKAHSRL